MQNVGCSTYVDGYTSNTMPKIYATLETNIKQIRILHLALNRADSKSYCFSRQTWWS